MQIPKLVCKECTHIQNTHTHTVRLPSKCSQENKVIRNTWDISHNVTWAQHCDYFWGCYMLCYFYTSFNKPRVFSKCNQSPFIIFRFLSAVTLGIGVMVWNFTAQADTWAGVAFPFLSLDRMWQTGLTGHAQPFILQEQHPSSVACIPFASLLFFYSL